MTDTVFLFFKSTVTMVALFYINHYYIYIYTWQILLVPGFVSALTLSFNRRFFIMENNGSVFF